MEYGVLPRGMWAVFGRSFRRHLPLITNEPPEQIMKRAKQKYRAILTDIPEFDRNDRFLVNILSAAMVAGVYLNLPEKPDLKEMTKYYSSAMTETAVMQLLKRHDHYTTRAQALLARQAEESQAQRNPYSWKFRYVAGPDTNSYSAYFDTCGILHLFQELGISEIVPALCAYDYDMAALSNSEFTREQTLAGGGGCCDCHYRKKSGL